MLVRLPEHMSLGALLLERPLDASSWTGIPREDGSSRPNRLHGPEAVHALISGLPAELAGRQVFLQHRMDDLGRHEYIDASAIESALRERGGAALRSLRIVDEDHVKPLLAAGKAVSFVAGAVQDLKMPSAPPPPTTDDARLCPPMSYQANYSVIEDLTLGRTQRVMLADESTLARGGPHMPPIFNHLTLIVNCHQDVSADRPGKYRVGLAKPTLIFQPVHKLYGAQPSVVLETLHAICTEMWRAHQHGSIAVHCLAGLHRAPAVVCCYYLYRFYALGHRHLSNDITVIYQRMRAVRPAVAPLGYIELIKLYERHMIRQHGNSTGK